MRMNGWAIGVSVIVLFVGMWLWYDVIFQRVWVAAMAGAHASLPEDLDSHMAYLLFVTFGMLLLAAYGLALVLSWCAPMSALRGAWVGFLTGVFFFGSMTWLVDTYSGWGPWLALINTGYVVAGLTVTGAILGGWRPKSV